MNWLRNLIKDSGLMDSKEVKELRRALKEGDKGRDPEDMLTKVVQDYPLLLELAKAYVEQGDTDTAQEVLRMCFRLRDEYAQWTGDRSAFSVKRVSKEFIKIGREDLAQHILMKVKNFESGIPLHLLSEEFVPDREALKAELEKPDKKSEDETS